MDQRGDHNRDSKDGEHELAFMLNVCVFLRLRAVCTWGASRMLRVEHLKVQVTLYTKLKLVFVTLKWGRSR